MRKEGDGYKSYFEYFTKTLFEKIVLPNQDKPEPNRIDKRLMED